jgi:tRNA nucleotidyltransferase (CCA-adding enzyme)
VTTWGLVAAPHRLALPSERQLLLALSPAHREAVTAARGVARRRGVGLYLVGGPVRDLLLQRPVGDLDLTVEGDAPALARELARVLGARVQVHAAFRTATLTLPDGERLDLATARTETYPRPGALPVVRPADIGGDLLRRDFTINALALKLAPDFEPRLLDPTGGRRDLQDGVIRFLHDRSPVDDPTRAFRAVRYAHRFGFRIPRETRDAIRAAIERGCFEAVSGDRLRRELQKILSERDRPGALRRLRELGLHRVLHPSLTVSRTLLERLRQAEGSSGPSADWLTYLQVWATELAPEHVSQLARRLNLSRKDADRLRAGPPRRRAPQPSGLTIAGKNLLAAGASPGPALGWALAQTLIARREGRITAEEELDFALAVWRDRQ